MILKDYATTIHLALIQFKSQAVLMAGKAMQFQDVEIVLGRKHKPPEYSTMLKT